MRATAAGHQARADEKVPRFAVYVGKVKPGDLPGHVARQVAFFRVRIFRACVSLRSGVQLNQLR